MTNTVTFTEAEAARVSSALLGDAERSTEHMDGCRRLAARPGADPKYAEWAVDAARRRALTRHAYSTLHGLTPSHFTFNERRR